MGASTQLHQWLMVMGWIEHPHHRQSQRANVCRLWALNREGGALIEASYDMNVATGTLADGQGAWTTPCSARGWWMPGAIPLVSIDDVWSHALAEVAHDLALVWAAPGQLAVGIGGVTCYGSAPPPGTTVYPLQAHLPALTPDALGAASFRRKYGLRYACIAGAMANGIGSTQIVEAMAHAGMMGMFGAAGLDLSIVEAAIQRCRRHLGTLPFGSNLIHSPNEPAVEDGIVSLYLREGIQRVSASAYLDLTLPLLRYRFTGIYQDKSGAIICPNQVLAKVSRLEVARHMWSPPPMQMLQILVQQGHLTEAQAQLATHMPVAEDVIAEADSGGHTDNQPAMVLFSVLSALRSECLTAYGYQTPLHLGLAGGIATPQAVASAFAMGADFVLTGSINQACVEAGTSEAVRHLLAKAKPADVIMAPAADMFEMGVQVQVLKWGTMFGVKARKLYDLYRSYASLEALPDVERKLLERDYFRCTLEEAWTQTAAYFATRDPAQNERALRDPKHRMALVFRSYLGRASRWANAGEPSRTLDYQIWCGPAMGAFNQWAKGSFLEAPEARRVATIGLNLMAGACVLTRVHWLQLQGVVVPPMYRDFRPQPLVQLQAQAQAQAHTAATTFSPHHTQPNYMQPNDIQQSEGSPLTSGRNL